MQEIFQENTTRYNLRNNEFIQPRVRSVSNGTQSIRFKFRNCGKHYHQQYGILKTFINFENNIKNWYGKNCPCKLCHILIPNLGYL